MSIENNGDVRQPDSQNADQYAEYYELNAENTVDDSGKLDADKTAVNEQETQVQKPDESKTDESDAKERTPRQEREPHYLKAIRKLTAQKKSLKEELEKIKASNSSKEREYTEENFATRKEYLDYERKRMLNDIRAELRQEMLEKQLSESDEQEWQIEADAFRSSWTNKVDRCYGTQSENERKDFERVVRDLDFIKNLPSSVQDFVESSDIGPIMLHTLNLRQDKLQQIANAKPGFQVALLMRLEDDINAYIANANKRVSSSVSKAPNPIGAVNTNGSSLDDDGSDATAYNNYMRKRMGR